MSRRPFTITGLEFHEDGYWTGRVTCDGVTVVVDNRHGSWMASVRIQPRARSFVQREVLPHIAAELQAKVRRAEKRQAVVA